MTAPILVGVDPLRHDPEAPVLAALLARATGAPVVAVAASVVALEQFSHDVDLLVCGSRGYGPIGSVLLGGVSRRLLHRAACPVIVVPRGTERALEELAAASAVESGHV
jgi:nucleotide-binding universal stress UspA family protein